MVTLMQVMMEFLADYCGQKLVFFSKNDAQYYCTNACDYSKLENEIKTKFGAWCAEKKIYFVITKASQSFTK